MQEPIGAKLTGIAMRQLANCYTFKLPRINRIRRFRDLYNNKAEKQLRIRYNVPIPIFSGMIDTLQADLDDALILKYNEDDPADWKAAQKANAALDKEMKSMRPGAMWNYKMRQARKEMLFSGRGFLKMTSSNDDGFKTELTAPTFEDMYFEPKGGSNLENHLFCGQSDIWKTQKDLENNDDGYFDKKQVKKLLSFTTGNEYKQSSFWLNYDYSNRFLSLGLTAESNNYVGEPMFNIVEWGLTHQGQRYKLLFEAFSGTWLSCEKLEDFDSSGYWPWMSFASHEDAKNFASKGFADDLYPHAVVMTDFFNEDMENRKRRNSNARAYDKDMFPNVAQLDEAQMGRDRLVEVDTKGGTRRIDQGIYTFQTPEITGTIEMLGYLESMAGRSFGVTDLQQGAKTGNDNKVGITMLESQSISQRLSFESQPFVEVGQQLGQRFFSALKDRLSEPLSIKILGEDGYNWDTLKRIDLNIKRNFEISVVSQNKQNKTNEINHAKKINALLTVRNTPPQNPGINGKMIDEFILRDSGMDETDIKLILDPQSHATKETIAETSTAIQEIMKGKVPKMNYNATAYFLQVLLDFVKTHQDDSKVAKKMNEFMDYITKHEQIAAENEARRAQKDAMLMKQGIMGGMNQPGTQPEAQEMTPASPMIPSPVQSPSISQIPA